VLFRSFSAAPSSGCPTLIATAHRVWERETALSVADKAPSAPAGPWRTCGMLPRAVGDANASNMLTESQGLSGRLSLAHDLSAGGRLGIEVVSAGRGATTHLGFVENTSWPLVQNYFRCSLSTSRLLVRLKNVSAKLAFVSAFVFSPWEFTMPSKVTLPPFTTM